MLLILPVHALVLIGLRGGLNDVESSVLWAIHVFRLPLFFLIAGFFAALVANSRGTGAFLRNRAIRIGVPLAVGVLLVVPPITLEARRSPNCRTARAQGVAAFADPHPSFLWFLWYLALIYGGALLVRRALAGLPAIKRVLLRAEWLLSGWHGPLLLAVPTALTLYRQPTWIPDAPAESFARIRTCSATTRSSSPPAGCSPPRPARDDRAGALEAAGDQRARAAAGTGALPPAGPASDRRQPGISPAGTGSLLRSRHGHSFSACSAWPGAMARRRIRGCATGPTPPTGSTSATFP